MAAPVTKRFTLDEYRLEPETRLLIHRDGKTVHLPHRPFQVLLYLIEHRDRLVSRAELLDLFWEGRDVYDVTLTKCVGKIRKALGDQLDKQRFIETRYADGYRFIGPLEEQLVNGEQEIVDIERTRGVKIVVEEQEIHSSASASEAVTDVLAQVRRVNIAGRRTSRRAIATVVACSVISITALSALIIDRNKSRALSQPAPVDSIAVMPLKNLTGDPANEYLSDGLSETLINSLSKIGGLKVISRTSSFTFKDKEIDPREVGSRLNVATLLEGSVLKSGDQLRIEVRLVDARDGHVMWARDSYDRSFGEVFALQDEIAGGVSAALRLRLNPEVAQRVAKRYTDNTEAYKAYLLGRYYLNKRTGEALKKAIEYFDQATNNDASYALAYAGLADCYRLGVWYIPLDAREAIAKTKSAATKAVEIDATIGETHRALAGAYAMEWNWASCEKELVRAIEIDPGSADALHDYSLYLNYTKRPDESIEMIRKAQELDPLSLVINSDLGLALYYARRYDEAIAAYRKVLEMDANFTIAHFGLGDAYLRKGRYAEAIDELQRAVALGDHATIYLTRLGEAYSHAGREAEGRQVLVELNDLARKHYVPPCDIARMYTVLGNKDEAFVWLEKAYRERSAYLVNLPIDPTFDPLRSDARFTNLLRRVGLPS